MMEEPITKENYLQVVTEAKDRLITLAKSPNNWKLAKQRNGLSVFLGETDDGSILIRTEALVKGTVASILNTIFENEHVGSKSEIIEKYDENHHFGYQQSKMRFPISSRDFVTFKSRQVLSDNLGVCLSTSTLRDDAPLEKKFVRGVIHLSGYVVEQCDDQLCKVTFVMRVEYKGWVPERVVRSAILKQGIFRIRFLRLQMDCV
jgi:hypothetical protein